MLRLLSVGFATLITLSALTASPSPTIPDVGGWTSKAKPTATGQAVVIAGERARSGDTAAGTERDALNGRRSKSSAGDRSGRQELVTPTPAPPDPLVAVDCVAPDVACTANPTPSPVPKGRVIPAVTLTDLVAFRPAAPKLASEPDGVGVVGLPTNLIAATKTQTLHGTLFDFPVAVRFTPHHYTFAYGDGTTHTSSTAGRSWTATGDPQFTPTGTSHAYRQRGTFTATVTVSYTPAVNFGDGSWRPVTGYVTSTSAGSRIRVYEAHTALVARTCIEDPTGPGC